MIYKATLPSPFMETDAMITEPIDNDGNPLMCCLTCGEPYSATGFIDVIDTETMTAQVVCHMSCFDAEADMILIPDYAFDIDGEPDIPEWAFTQPDPEPVSVDDSAPVVQIRAEWDSVTDVLMYEDSIGDHHLDDGGDY